MTQKEKDLLIKGLCGGLPYNIKVEAKGLLKTIANDYDDRNIINAHVLNGLNLGNYFKTYSINSMVNAPLFNRKGVCNIKPYLFPLSSMTEEQMNDCPIGETNLNIIKSNIGYGIIEIPWRISYLFIDWCNKNHFDYLGLIPMGLANDATGLNIY